MTRTSQLAFALWLVFIGSIGSPQPCGADTIVTLHPRIEASRSAIRLSDIFEGVPAEIDRDIARAPNPGQQVTYDTNVLTRIAHTYRLDWEPQSSLDHVVVTTPCTRITADTIREAVIQKVRENSTSQDIRNVSMDVTFDNHALEVDLPADQAPDFTLNNFTFNPVNKYFRADLVADTSSGPFSAPVTGHVSVKRTIPVLAHQLDAHTTISADDISWIQVPEERITSATIVSEHDLIGRELRRDTNGDEIINTHDVMPPRFIVRGTLITMQIETPFMSLTVQGKALQDGVKGDVVRVLNTQSNRVIEGTVSAPGTVVIHTTIQKMASAQ